MIVSLTRITETKAYIEVHDDLCRNSWAQIDKALRSHAAEFFPGWKPEEITESHSNRWGGARIFATYHKPEGVTHHEPHHRHRSATARAAARRTTRPLPRIGADEDR